MEYLTKYIEGLITEFPEGQVFGYKDLKIEACNYTSVAKILERFSNKGYIRKYSKGLFYKPKETIFGTLQPTEEEILKPYIFDRGKRVAYITGIALYNKLGLTTQLPVTFQLATFNKKIIVNKKNLKVTSVKSYFEITNENYHLLELLDVIKDYNTIPDFDFVMGLNRVLYLLKQLKKEEIIEMLTYALNPFSTYKINVSGVDLPTIKNWNIV